MLVYVYSEMINIIIFPFFLTSLLLRICIIALIYYNNDISTMCIYIKISYFSLHFLHCRYTVYVCLIYIMLWLIFYVFIFYFIFFPLALLDWYSLFFVHSVVVWVWCGVLSLTLLLSAAFISLYFVLLHFIINPYAAEHARVDMYDGCFDKGKCTWDS